MARKRTTESDYTSKLEKFERCLETPIVSGDLVAWFEAAKEASQEAQEAYREAVCEDHAEMLDEILEQDAALGPRVEELKTEQEQLLDRWSEFQKQLDAGHRAAKRSEPNEAKLQEPLDDLTERGLRLVISLRKQETALRTWHTEALHRDRGIAD